MDPPLTDEEFEKLCAANDRVQLERTKEGTIVVNPPAGFFSSDANTEIIYQLRTWWKQHRRGRIADSNGGFFLPDGSSLIPDAAYVTAEQLQAVPKEELNHFLHLTPAFVIELLSYSDNLTKAKEKMESWIANGAQVGWLIDPYRQNVLIYEPGKPPSLVTGDDVIGTGPVAGFVFDLTSIWEVYK